LRIDHLPQPTAADRAAILAPLDAFSRGRGFAWQPAPLALALRDAAGGIAGGLIGEAQWGWLRIDILAVAEGHRGGGWGRRLVEAAERAAVAAGCHAAWVDTFSFQSPGFYRRLGYEVFGELPDYPAGQVRLFLRKRLVPADRRHAEPGAAPDPPSKPGGQVSGVVRRRRAKTAGASVARGALWFLVTCVGLGFAASAALVAESLRPEPGANMVLMGLPLVAAPTALCAAAALAVAGSASGLRRWERRAAYAACGLAAAVFAALAALG
jgi:GNAT superfamily N-acetyltransferase